MNTMDSTTRPADEEIQKSRLEIGRLQAELDQNPVRFDTLLLRNAAQRKLDEAQTRLAELEEVQLVDQTKAEALDSGLVECLVATQETGECPLCLEDIPNIYPATLCVKKSKLFHRLVCCGAICCVQCFDQQVKRIRGVVENMQRGNFPEKRELEAFMAELLNMEYCPFCRSPNLGESHMLSLIQRSADDGKGWALARLGNVFEHGSLGATQDRWRAAELMQQVVDADASDVNSLTDLGRLWEAGFPEKGIGPCMKKQKDCFLRAARQGYHLAQYYYAETLTKNSTTQSEAEAALPWYILCADQGFSLAQYKISEYYEKWYRPDEPNVVFKCIYWLRKSALQGFENAQLQLALMLLEAKAMVFDQRPDMPGHSAVPEACFWFDLVAAQEPTLQRPLPLHLLQCAACHEPAVTTTTSTATTTTNPLRRCTRCKGARYCGRDCQELHWKMGHKHDCRAVQELKKALIVPSTTEYDYPVHRPVLDD